MKTSGSIVSALLIFFIAVVDDKGTPAQFGPYDTESECTEMKEWYEQAGVPHVRCWPTGESIMSAPGIGSAAGLQVSACSPKDRKCKLQERRNLRAERKAARQNLR